MTPHTKIYVEYFGYGEQSFMPCEICGRRAVDVAHIDHRGMGGSKTKDYIENLMGLCRTHHNHLDNGIVDKDVYKARHEMFMNENKTD